MAAKLPALSTVLTFLRRGGLLALLSAVVIAAHPSGPWEGLGNVLWEALSPFGLDVAMTPVTSDMQLMLDSSGSGERYLRKIDVEVGGRSGSSTLSVSDLGFYRFRIPFLLMSELAESRSPIQAHLYAICSELGRKTGGPPQWFRVRLLPAAAGDARMGFNVRYSCLSLREIQP